MSECFIIFFFEWKPQAMTLENPSDSGYFRNCTTATLGFQIGSQIIVPLVSNLTLVSALNARPISSVLFIFFVVE